MPSLATDLARIVGTPHAVAPVPAEALRDATEWSGMAGRADVLVRPGSAAEAAAVLAWCYEHDVPVTARGGGTGLAGGAVPDGGAVLALERLNRVRRFEPARWRIEVEAGVSTATVRRLARESGLIFGPDPGAAEASQIGGNIATDAGGPHALRHGPTGRWVTGVEAAVAPGVLVKAGGALPREVAGYDLAALLCGSEGTLGIVTSAWLRLRPAPAAALPVVAVFESADAAQAALLDVFERGAEPAALDFLDAGALRAAAGAFPGELPGGAFMLLADAEGTAAEAQRTAAELREAFAAGTIVEIAAPAQLWRWRDGIAHAVAAVRGGKLSEDVAVPLEHLAQACARIAEIARSSALEPACWGHAGDGVIHASLGLDRNDPDQVALALAAAEQIFDLALHLGGSLSGEHGLGRLKRHRLPDQAGPALAVHRTIKAALDPKGLLNPGVGV